VASPSTVLTMGFGAWGSVNLLPTLGFGQSAAVVPDVPGVELRMPHDHMHYALPKNRMHYRLPYDRMHSEVGEE
jgi:hypothetical protein